MGSTLPQSGPAARRLRAFPCRRSAGSPGRSVQTRSSAMEHGDAIDADLIDNLQVRLCAAAREQN